MDRLQAARARPQAGRRREAPVRATRSPDRRPIPRTRHAGPGTGRAVALVRRPGRSAGRIRREARRPAARSRPAVVLAAPFRYGDARAPRRGRRGDGPLGRRRSLSGGRVLRSAYLYVSPWPRFDGNLPALPPPGHWHTEGFFGAVATG